MLNKTLRSVLSLMLVFCLLLGMSGNAIARAVDDPVGDAIDQIDKEVNDIFAEMRDLIGELEEEIDELENETLADAVADLIDAEKKLGDAEAELEKLTAAGGDVTDAYNQWEDAKKKLADAKDVLEGQKLAELRQTAYNKAWAQFETVLRNEEAGAWDQFALALGDQYPAENQKLQAALKQAKTDLRAAIECAGSDAEAEKAAWAAYDADVKAAWDTFNSDTGYIFDAVIKEVAGKIENAKVSAKKEFDEKFDIEFNKKLAEVSEEVRKAEEAMVKVEAYVNSVKDTVEYYQGVIVEAKAAIVKAWELVGAARTTITEARKTIAQAHKVVDNLENGYNDLCDAINDADLSIEYIEETAELLADDYDAVWTAVLVLDGNIDDLIVAYDALAEYEIGEIDVHRDSIDGFTVGPFQVEVDTDGDGVVEVYGVAETKLPDVDLSEYDFHFDGVEIPEKPEGLTEADETLDEIISEVTSLHEALEYYAEAAEDLIEETLDMLEEEFDLTMDYIEDHLNEEGLQEVYDWLYENPDEVCALVEEFGIYALDLLVEYGPYALDLLEEHYDLAVLGVVLVGGGIYAGSEYVDDVLEFLAEYEDDIYEAARDLYDEYGEDAEALIEVYVDYLELRERYDNATYSDYTVFHDSLYVAIGDGTALPGGYTDKLAELMGIPHMTKNLAQIDLTVEQAIDLVKENAELIGKADLITLGFSNIHASTEVLNILTKDENYDWTGDINDSVSERIDDAVAELKDLLIEEGFDDEYLDMVDEAVELIDEALAELDKRLNEEGLDEPTVNLIVEAVEAYGIAYLERAAWYPSLVDTVRDINPDALIVLVGTYNDLEGVTVDVRGEQFDIGEYTQYLIAAANLENLAQAFFSDGVIYADAYDVETVFEEYDYDSLNNLGYFMSILNDEMLPSEAGHAHIAERIYSALNVKYAIWGDVNGDRKVNCRDARLLLMYAAELITEDDIDLTWADVTGDGKVNVRDARMVLRYCAELIEHFPVCNVTGE